MRIGVPKEIKPLEGRVALVPEAAGELVRAGSEVYLQTGAGEKSGYPDSAYREQGIQILPDAAALYRQAQIIVKVKEPIAPEYDLLRPEHVLFSYLHLAAVPELARVLMQKGLTAVAFETVEVQDRLPLLAPMSEIAGRLAVQIGAHLLHVPQGGRGILLGGLPGTEHGQVVVLGAGEAGGAAVAAAAALGAEVTVFARSRDSLARMCRYGPNVTALHSSQGGGRRGTATSRFADWRGAYSRRAHPASGDTRHGPQHASRVSDRGHLRRPGRLHRDHTSNRLQRPDLCRGGGDPLRRDEYARGGTAYRLAGPVRGDCPVCRTSVPAWLGARSVPAQRN